jgi:hypothetical protein
VIREGWKSVMGRILRHAFNPPRSEEPPSRNLKEALRRLDDTTHSIKVNSERNTNSEVLSQLLERIR